MKPAQTIKSTQEQAVASWINYLNQERLKRLMQALTGEQQNLKQALSTIRQTLDTISKKIVNNGQGRGGTSGMHGFIAEVAQVGISNAREQIDGRTPICVWIDDNCEADIFRGATAIQQKFVNSGNHLSLQAIRNHLHAYPDFIRKGGMYQIPADHYEKIKWLLSIPEDEANRMPTSTGEFSLRQWREVHQFFEDGDVPLDRIEPAVLKFDEVQRDSYSQTLRREEGRLRQINKERRQKAYERSKPSRTEGAKATVVSAAVEGGTTFCLKVAEKRRSGKRIRDFDPDDWRDIAADSGAGVAKGGVRGLSIYMLTNYTATPASVASALATTAFGVAEQAHLLRKGLQDEQSFIENSEMLCLDAAVSALSSLAGEVLIPLPVIGAVIGNAVGTVLYQSAKDNLSAREQAILEGYLKSLDELNARLDAKYREFISGISEAMIRFMDILERAFAPDIRTAFAGSVELARELGVPAEEILDSKRKLYSYFMD